MPITTPQDISPQSNSSERLSPEESCPEGTWPEGSFSEGIWPIDSLSDDIFRHNFPIPEPIEGSMESLGTHSVLSDLPSYRFSVPVNYPIPSLIEHFTQLPNLPGVVLLEGDRISVLSRQQFLECWLQLGYTSLFAEGAVRLLLNQANRKVVSLPGDLPILSGAQHLLKRSPQQQSEPILIQHDNSYRLLDARTLNVAHWQIRGIETQVRYERLQIQLLQSEKMAALGRLVDGVAHEILDPVGFIWGNLSYIDDYVKKQQDLLLAYEAALPNPSAAIIQLQENIELDYLRSDLPAALKSARGGAHRLRQLATSLQNFCHIDDVHPRPTDLNTLIDSTLRLLKSRLSSQIKLECCYGKLPPVSCFAGQLSQVFMNLFTDAIDSLLAQAQPENYDNGVLPAHKMPQITVTTCVRADKDAPSSDPHELRWVSIIVSDNGPGLLPAVREQILDSFSAKSRSRKETGLAMSYQIVTAKHGGRFWLRSLHASEYPTDTKGDLPTGTEYEILLPLTSGEN